MNRRVPKIVVLLIALLPLIRFSGNDVRAQKAKAAAPKLSSADCLACHNNPELTKEVNGKQISVAVNEATFKNSVHGPLDCTACHTDVKAYPHDPAPQPVTACATCHESAGQEYQTSVHAAARQKGNTDSANCAACHGTHNILPKADPKSTVHHLNIADTCAKCHEDERLTKANKLAPPEFIRKYRDSVHGRGVKVSGLMVSATCSDCHGAHGTKSHTDPQSNMARANLPNTCSKCHLGIFNDFAQSTHGELWKQGETRGPVCATCHQSHEIKAPTSAGFQLQVPNECAHCHNNKTQSYRDTFHGQATSLGLAVAAKCSDCHTPHHNLPQNNPASSVAPGNLVQTCGKCHAGANASFVTYDPHADPADKNKSQLVWATFTFMKWLLLGVFGFFSLHTVLWFQRALVAWRRKETPAEHENGQYVQRFSLAQRLTHLVIILSFLWLAATGLPLKYHDTGWGHALGTLMGGVEVTRFFHRLWAVATFGYAFYHLWFLLKRIVKERDFSLLHGPSSLVPRKQDFIDLAHNFRWFFYRGPRPKLDRWTYWEKFDYFAVFWGIPVIGLSGLALWLPGLFTKFLPGKLLNVAMILHGEEALLAVGFIFAFHFFHNHLRPENFPLDTVMFTGKLPLARFIAERPAEYERLVATGKLDEVLTGPPDELTRKVSTWFGLTALVIGLTLALAIFATYLIRS